MNSDCQKILNQLDEYVIQLEGHQGNGALHHGYGE